MLDLSHRPLPPTAGGHYNLRVVAFTPSEVTWGEVTELACCDVVVDDSSPGVGAPRCETFGTAVDHGCRPCNPADVARLIWEHWTPDVIVAHDAASASTLFGPAITGRLPWLSLHRVARRVWPHAPDGYSVEDLARWRSVVGRAAPISEAPGHGAAREAHLTAALLAELLSEPSLPVAGMPVECGEVERRRRLGAVFADMLRNDAVQSAVRISSLCGPPADPQGYPGPWDEDHAWSRLGVEDLRWIAMHGRRSYPAAAQAAARAELSRRARAAVGAVPRLTPLVLRRIAWN